MTNIMDDLPPDNSQVDYYAELAGPGKKFDVQKYSDDKEWLQAVLKGKYEADRMIDHKNTEFDKLRDDFLKERESNDTRAKLSQLYDLLSNERQLPASNDNTQVNEDQRRPNLDPNELRNIVRSEFNSLRSVDKEDENAKNVRDKLIERYGRNFRDVIKQQAEELDISESEMNELARKRPRVFMKTFGLDQEPTRESFHTPPRSSDSFAPRGQQIRSWSYYEKMRREDPDEYYKPKTQVQMHRDHAEFGKKFEDGNWSSL